MPPHLQHRPGPRLPMAWLLAGFVGGTVLQLQQPVLWSGPAYAALLVGSLGAALAGWRLRRLAVVFALLAGTALGAGTAGLRAVFFQADALAPGLEGRDVRVEGTVAAMPQRSEAGLRLRLEVDAARAVDGEAAPVTLPPLLDLGWYAFDSSAPAEVRAGERWAFTVRLKAPHGLRNPGGFDYELWLWEQGVQATGSIRAGARQAAPQRLGDSAWRHPVERARQAVRDAIFQRLGRFEGGSDPARARAAGVVAALVTGDQRAIDRADWDVFRATGVAHLVSISGLHITMFAWLATAAVGGLWRRSARLSLWLPAPTAALLAGVALAAAYALFSGWGVPSQRTVCMLAVAALLRLGARRWPWPQVWLLACAAVVALDPWALLQAGFWLSFVAVGVLFATDGGIAAAAGGVLHRLRALLREQWIVTLALAPLTLLLFGQVSVVGLLANLVAIPWVTAVVTPLAMLGLVWPALWSAAAWCVQALALLLQWMAGWPGATFSVAAAPLWAGIAGVGGGLLLVARLPGPLRALGLPLVLPVLLWQPPRPAAGSFELTAVDVGQGAAVLVRTATHALLYDTGPRYSRDSDAGHRVLVPLLQRYGERLDMVVVSHRDDDHAGGAAAVLAQQPQAALRGSLEAAHPLWALRQGQRCEAGQQWDWDGVHFAVLHPQPGDYDRARMPSNALSCVLRISAGNASALLTGDIPAAQEAALSAGGAPLTVDWLMVPHHGSRFSSSEVFLGAVRPRWAVVQAGYRNRFGHPAPEVVGRLQAAGARVIASPSCGASRWSSATPAELACERHRAPRYWQHAAAPP